MTARRLLNDELGKIRDRLDRAAANATVNVGGGGEEDQRPTRRRPGRRKCAPSGRIWPGRQLRPLQLPKGNKVGTGIVVVVARGRW